MDTNLSLKLANNLIKKKFPNVKIINKENVTWNGNFYLKCSACKLKWNRTKLKQILKSIGCPNCFKQNKFEQQIKGKHGNKIKVVSSFISRVSPLKFKCINGHIFECNKAEQMLINEHCPDCFYQSRKTKNYEDRLKEIYADKIKPLQTYECKRTPILHLCKIHGKFKSKPSKLLYFHHRGSRYGCPKCGLEQASVNRRITYEEVLIRIKKYHGNKVKLLSNCDRLYDRGTFKCNKGHIWETGIQSVANGSGCIRCNCPNKGSRKGIKFVKQMTNNRPEIRHADHPKGEYGLRGKSGKYYRVDGFDPINNIVYEFHGDVWHGNPAKFEPNSKPHPFSDLTAKQLYVKTKRREQDIAKAGYKLFCIWESGFRDNKATNLYYIN